MEVNMNKVVGKNDILFISLDTLRYDVAEREYLAGNLLIYVLVQAGKKDTAR